jgi:hypothetical protein
MSRKVIVALAVASLLAGGFLSLYAILCSDAVNPWTRARIHIGMSETQVQDIIGRPADKEYHPWDIVVFMTPAPGSSPEWEKMWLGKEWMILVQFDSDHRVCQVGCLDKDFDRPPARSVSRFLWRWLGW